MKKVFLILTALLSLGVSGVRAEGNGTAKAGTHYYIKAPRFVRPLIEKWISEYTKVEPGVDFQIVKGNGKQDQVDLQVVLATKSTNSEEITRVILVGEYAILPITARDSEAARLLTNKRLSEKKLKSLFFLDEEFEETKKSKDFERIVIYSGSNASSVAVPFASHFGEEANNFRGKRISGDDIYLNTAITKDPLGVSFNALSNIFDLQSRQLKGELSLIGVNVKKEYEQAFSDHATIDDIIKALEHTRPDGIPVEKVGLSYNGYDDAVEKFIMWVLTQGTAYNHEYGLLDLDQKLAAAQIDKVRHHDTAQK